MQADGNNKATSIDIKQHKATQNNIKHHEQMEATLNKIIQDQHKATYNNKRQQRATQCKQNNASIDIHHYKTTRNRIKQYNGTS